MSEWQPIETIPEGKHVLIFWSIGERGIGGIECATVYWSDGQLSYWTHGGPNAGVDWDTEEMPTHWMHLPEAPK